MAKRDRTVFVMGNDNSLAAIIVVDGECVRLLRLPVWQHSLVSLI